MIYKKRFKETKNIKDSDNLINVGLKNITIQDPFRISELNGKSYDFTNVSDIFSKDPDKFDRIYKKVDDINNEFNKIREILYQYTLIKIVELQREAE